MRQCKSSTARPASLEARAGELANALRRQIRYYLPDSQLPSHQSLVRQFGASMRVVRRTLEMLADEGLVRAQPRSGVTVLARARQQPAVRRVAAVISRVEARESFCQSIVLGADQQARRLGLHLEEIVSDADPCSSSWLEQLDRSQPPATGWLFIATSPTEDVLTSWRQQGQAVVLADQPGVNPQAHTVNSDGLGAAFMTTERLLLLGHRHIAYVGLVRAPGGQPINRIHGYRLAHQRHRAAVHESLVLDMHERHLRFDDLRRLMAASSPAPTAIMAANQIIGCEVLMACDRLGIRVPEQLSVTSCGMHRRELPAAMLDRLSRCDEGPPEELGQLAVEVLSGAHSHIGTNLILAPTDWQDHGSVGPPPGL
ncbi:MAG: HTH-type transcriptional repressor PurR [Phycisphaerae bacterium]|nr:HTH-type transcriptional repressor PurR [Phycisphaerae bacterium]